MPECTGSFFSEDTAFKETSVFDSLPFDSGVILYEVLRIYKENSLFLDDHLHRLQESVRLSGYPYTISVPHFHSIISGLIRKNGLSNGNVKIVLHFHNREIPVLFTYFIPHAYPTPAMYKHGVEADLYKAVRPNPNVKRYLPEVRRRISEFIQAEHIYDALLVDEDETVTEGSKTNVFFIRGEAVFTPPGESVLKGITREKVILLCNQLNIQVIEEPISINSLSDFSAAFFTGTSPKVLPICSIATRNYAVTNPVMEKIRKAYDDLIETFVS